MSCHLSNLHADQGDLLEMITTNDSQVLHYGISCQEHLAGSTEIFTTIRDDYEKNVILLFPLINK